MKPLKEMVMYSRCPNTGLSVSYAYKKGCRCSACKANKAIYTKNDVKAKTRIKLWLQQHPGKRQQYRKQHNNKKWLERYSQLRKVHDDRCQICGRITNVGTLSNGSRLHIDHCHKTGKLRGLLCGNCNVALGHFKDNVKLLKNAIKYLQENGDVY